jgi:hypothetical protein
LCDGDGERRPPQEARGHNEPYGLDCLGEERESVHRFRLGVEDRESGRDHQRVAGDQPTEDGRRRDERELARLASQNDRKEAEQDGRGNEAEAGARAFLEVIPDEGPVDAGANRTGEDDEAGA